MLLYNMGTFRLFALLVALSLPGFVDAGPAISEFMAVNDTGVRDEDGHASDWIEIRNSGAASVDLAGWHLTDDAAFPTKWTFPSTVLAAGEYLVVFASKKDRTTAGSELHTNFKLSATGEYLALLMPGGTTPATEFAPAYPRQFPNISYGTAVASADQNLVLEGTPAKAIVPDAAYDGAVGTSWRAQAPDFDESAWTSGLLGVGYERSNGYQSDIGLDMESDMYLTNATVYVRIPFAGVAHPADVVEMKLRMKYDDGFAAFLNGVPVASANAPGTLAWNSSATSSHSDDLAQIFADYDITAFTSSLSTNANLLAIHGLNMAINSSDLLILPQLEVRMVVTNSMASTGFLQIATPGTANPNAAYDGVVEDTNFSVGRGFYTNGFTETIICTEPGATLIHTLDGSEPSLANGVVTLPPDASTAPTTTVSIVTTTTLRARAVKDAHLPTNIDTQTYLFPLDVIHQTGAGYPLPPHPEKSDWDYEMDPDIVNDPRFPDVAGDLLTIPSLSLVMDRDALWGVDGVYANPDGYGFDWEAACSVEYLRPDGGPGFQEDGGFRLQGSGSRRTSRPWSKKSMRIAFRAMYGAGKLDFPLFGEDGAQKIDNIIVRGNYFDSWTVHADGSAEGIARSNAMVLRDEYGRQCHQDMEAWPAVRGGWVHLYLNGMYWGVYNIHERPDENFAEDRFGGDKEEYDVIKHGMEIVKGDRVAWDQLIATLNGDITDPAVYDSVRAQLDVDGFADYLLMNFYGGNNDWPHNNWYVMRHRPSNGPFTFVAWDVEHYIFLKNDFGPINTSTANSPGIIWARLRLNPEFLLYFADRVHKHMFNGGALTPERCSARFMGIVDTVFAGMNGEAARWGDAWGAPPYNTTDHYSTVVADKVNNYFPIRTSVVINNLRSQGYYPSIDAPEFSQHGGQVPVDYLLTITNASSTSPMRSPVLQGWTESGTGAGVDLEAVVDGGTNAWRIGDDASGLNPAYNSALSAADLTQMYQNGWEFEIVVRGVRDAGGGAGFGAWGVSTGNDPGWGLTSSERVGFMIRRESGSDAFQVGPEHGGTITLGAGSATNFHSIRCVGFPSSSEYEFFVDGVSQGVFDIKDGGSNGNYDDRVRVASGSTGGTGRETYWHSVELKAAGVTLAEYDADTTVSGGAGTIYFTTDGSDPRLAGGAVNPGATAGNALTISSPVRVKARALNGSEWSALTEADFVVAGDPPPGALVIPEFLYHPSPPEPLEEVAGFTDRDDFEYLELLNVSTQAVDLSNVAFTEGIGFAFSTLPQPVDRVLAPNERVVLASDTNAFAYRYGSLFPAAGAYSGKLDNGGETVALALGTNQLISFNYDDRAPWPESPDGAGPSLVLRDPYGQPDHADPRSWRASAFAGGSPGEEGPPEPPYPANPAGDDNTNGVPDLVDYAVAEPLSVDTAIVDSNRIVTVRYGQHLLADKVRIEVESTTNFVYWGSSTNYAPALEIHHGDGTVSYILHAPPPGSVDPMRAFRLNVVP